MKKDEIPAHLLERIEPELLTGENLLWVGVPTWQHLPPARRSEPVVTATIAGALALFVAIVLTFGTRGMLSIPGLLALLFLLIATTVLIAPFNQRLAARRQVYAITNRRLMILDGSRIRSFGKEDLDFIERRMHQDGSGDILFKQALPDLMGTPPVFEGGFFGIENPARVEALMLETFRQTSQVGSRLALESQSPAYEDEEDRESGYTAQGR